MAQRVQVTLEDDIDGGEAVSTVSFSIDGVAYEIDLNQKNRDKLDKAVGPFVQSARQLRVAGRGRPGRGGRNRSADNPAIRAWAKSKGMALSERGRIPGQVVAAWEADGSPR